MKKKYYFTFYDKRDGLLAVIRPNRCFSSSKFELENMRKRYLEDKHFVVSEVDLWYE